MIEGITSAPGLSECSNIIGRSVNSDAKQNKKEHTHTAAQSVSQKDTDATGLRLTPEQKKEVEELKKRDQEVRAHEQAHMAAGGDLASPASYTTAKGPDNKSYATGGEVRIDISPVDGNPKKTIEKAARIRSAALAPASPSGQDMQVAAQATQMEVQARLEIKSEESSKSEGKNSSKKPSNTELQDQNEKTFSNTKTSSIEELSSNAIIAGFFGSSLRLSHILEEKQTSQLSMQRTEEIPTKNKQHGQIQQSTYMANSKFGIIQNPSFQVSQKHALDSYKQNEKTDSPESSLSTMI